MARPAPWINLVSARANIYGRRDETKNSRITTVLEELPLMMNFLLTTLSLAAAVLAAPNPTVERRGLNTTASDRLGLKWMGNDTSLPKILVLFTGGTIASGSEYGALEYETSTSFRLLPLTMSWLPSING